MDQVLQGKVGIGWVNWDIGHACAISKKRAFPSKTQMGWKIKYLREMQTVLKVEQDCTHLPQTNALKD